MSDILSQIAQTTRHHVEKCKQSISLTDMEKRANNAPPVRGFSKNLHNAQKDNRFGLIAEIKKASPSKGLIREDFNPPLLAKAYEDGGASCLSVLTDQPYFMGDDQYLKDARAATSLPTLRKDFMLDPYQIIEARSLGADCILLIMAMIDDVLAAELEQTALDYNLDVLVEVHDANELERAHKLKSELLGINNRNLKTFEVSLSTSIELSKLADKNKLLISESGLFCYDDLKMLHQKCDINSFLIGEALMRQADVTKATRKMLFND